MIDILSQNIVNGMEDFSLTSDKKVSILSILEDQFEDITGDFINSISEQKSLSKSRNLNTKMNKVQKKQTNNLTKNIESLEKENEQLTKNIENKKNNIKFLIFNKNFVYDIIVFLSIFFIVLSLKIKKIIDLSIFTILVLILFSLLIVYYLYKKKKFDKSIAE